MDYTWVVMGIILVIIAVLMHADRLVIITLILLTAVNWMQEYQNDESQENFHVKFDDDVEIVQYSTDIEPINVVKDCGFECSSQEFELLENSPEKINMIDDSDDPNFVMYDVNISYTADDMAVRQGRARNYLERSIDGQMNRLQLLKSYVEDELDEAENSNGWHGASEY